MARQIQHRRGSDSFHAGFIGAEGEFTYNTDTKTIHAHDGETLGGHPMGKADGSNSRLVASDVIREIVTLYQSSYDALSDPDSSILYLIIPDIFEGDTTTYGIAAGELFIIPL